MDGSNGGIILKSSKEWCHLTGGSEVCLRTAIRRELTGAVFGLKQIVESLKSTEVPWAFGVLCPTIKRNL